MATVTDWAQSQRKGWLCELYGKDDTVTGARHLPTSSAQYRLVTILTDALSGTISSLESAKRTDSLVTTCIYVDAGMLFMNLLGLHFSAAETLNDEVILQCLADYMVELASLPDAINKGPIAQVIEAIDKGDSKEKRIEVGEVFELGDEGVLWRDLPGFGWNLTESFQGPEAYLYSGRSPATSEEATVKWRSINTYIALLASKPRAQRIPVLSGLVRLGIKTLVMALEYSAETNVGRNVACHVPAAIQWLKIAGDELERLCVAGTEHWGDGDLWEAEGGGIVCDEARWRFWNARLAELGHNHDLMDAI